MHIDVHASSPKRGLLVALCALLLAVAFVTPSLAAQPGAVKISEDPFGSVPGAVGQHATEVEPDSFSFGSTTVAAFQTGRVFDGGSTDIGFATSNDGGVSWTRGFLPSVTTSATPSGPYFAASDASVAFDAKHGAGSSPTSASTPPAVAARSTSWRAGPPTAGTRGAAR